MKDKRAVLLICFLLLVAYASQAQYANDWINFNQQYFKIPVSKDGVYKLTYSDLLNAGFPVNAVDPRFIQLYHRGQEQAIHIKGEADAVFNANDYLEFYGKKNDGTQDRILYKNPNDQPHRYYNLYSDTTAYFLTYTLSPPRGARMDSVQLVNVNNLPAEAYHYATRLQVYTNNYSGGFTINDVTQETTFGEGEGWTGIFLRQGNTVDYIIDSVYNVVQSAGNPKIEIQLVGLDYINHSLDIQVGSGLRTLSSVNFFGFSANTIHTDLNWSDVNPDGTVHVRVVAQSAATNRNQASVSYIKVTFPQSFDVSGLKKKTFTLEVNPSDASFITISNPPSGMDLWDLTDEASITRILTTASVNSISTIVPGTSVPKTLFAFTSRITPQVLPVSFRQIDPTLHDYIVISNKALMKPAAGYPDIVKALAGYRASQAGGNYDTLVVAVDQLYNQFNFGETSPSAIYSFMKWMAEKGSPRFLFIIGKGKDISSYSTYARKSLKVGEKFDFVPSAGLPGGDNAFTAGLLGTTYDPAVATGRFPATNTQQVAAYLSKMIELESKPLQPWAKELLHLSGGFHDAAELRLFRSYVDGFKVIAEGPYLGGHVTTKSKSDLGLERVDAEEDINRGVNLVTFFGHSSSSATDIDIGFVDDPSLTYNNPGKYPAFLINGCNTGTIFTDEVTFGEDWIMATNKGARNFIASTSFSDELITRNYTTQFYQVGFADSVYIKKGIGEIQRETTRRFLDAYGTNIYTRSIIQQMTLTGDPALKLFGTALPDYSVNNGSLSLVSVDDQPVTSLSPSFGLKIIVKNEGAVVAKPFTLRVIRTFNNNTTQTYDSAFAPVYFSDTLLFKIRNDKGVNGFGNNLFTVVIDPSNAIQEVNENNNSATLSYFIPSNGTLNLYPPPYGIVASSNINFLFQDANLLGGQRDFQIQVDTTKTFDSPFVIKQTVSAKVLVKKNISLPSTDSTVYFWRTKPVKKSVTDSSDWTNSSFVFIQNSPEGWAQTKFDQIVDNTIVGLLPVGNSKTFDYLQTVSTIDVKSIGANSASPYTSASLKVDGIEFNLSTQGLQCRTNTINLVAFNKSSVIPYPGIAFDYLDLRGCGRQPKVINSFTTAEMVTGNGDDLLQYVNNISPGDSVVLFSIGDAGFSSWSPSVLAKLGDLGISNTQITSLQNGEPVIIFARKGAAVGSAKIFRSVVVPQVNQDLSVSQPITGRFSSATISSVTIGPANNWIKFIPKITDIQASDVYSFTIYGINLTGEEDILAEDVTETLDLAFVDPYLYPKLRVEVNMNDNVLLTPVTLNKWFVFYESVAEGFLFFNGSTDTQTVQEGQPFTRQFGFVNISDKQFFDSLLVNASTANSVKGIFSNSFRIKAPAPGDTTRFPLAINTVGKAGLNDITVFVNPKIEPEQFYENNVIELFQYLNVEADHFPPSLDVTVDGRYLQNGDFVSASPEIKVKLHDDNKFFFVSDTSKLTVLLSYPCSSSTCPFTRVSFSRSDVQWSPASATKDFEFLFLPAQLTEGTYVLQVLASDASGNKNASPYEISFEVKNETTLLLNAVYPNPSNGIFNFNFILSGNVLPDEFSLQIFSSEGRLLQDYSKEDVSNFIIGTNNLSWHTQESSGILIYQLKMSVNGKSVTQTGKLALIR